MGFISRMRHGEGAGSGGPADADAVALRALARAGGHPDRPTEIVNRLYLASEELAESAAGELRFQGLVVEVMPSGPRWLVQARGTLIPSRDVRGMRAVFETLASTLDGEYAGWEATASA